jgi:hypothetical protein
MRLARFCSLILLCAARLCAQEPAVAPSASPNEALRSTIRQWVETMKRIQKEEDDWERDREILENYKEGLTKEIEELKSAIASAQDRKAGADQESLDKTSRREAYGEARKTLAAAVRKLEQDALAKAKLLPAVLRTEPKTAQALEDIETDVNLTGDQADQGLAKRLNNLLTLLGEAEKFQQTVHVRDELHQRRDGTEFNLKMVYFGLAVAYGVNDGGDFAVVGRPGQDGWKYDERPELAARIRQLVGSATGDVEAAFVPLPLEIP